MALSHIGTNTQDSGGALSLTFTIPAAAQSGDLMIAFVKQSENTSQQTWDDDGGGGNGWTREVYNRTTGGRDQETAIYWKVHDGSESNPTFTWASGVTAEPMSGSLEVYRGSNPTITHVNFRQAQNDATPPTPESTITQQPTSVINVHFATHDDISSPAPPTNFTMRGQVWAGTSNDHRNTFVSDRLNFSPGIGSYAPSDWQHSVLNTTPEYHTYSLVIDEVAIGITDQGDEQLDTGDTNELIDGFGFEATQGTGKVELADGLDYATATKVLQTIDTWSDTQIQFDPVFTGFVDGSLYVFVTNDSGDRTAGYKVNFGNPSYGDVLFNLDFDIIHSFNNTFADTGARLGGYAANGQVDTASNSFKSQSGVPGGNSHCWGPDDSAGKIEMNDTPYTNQSSAHTMREICGWVKAPATAYKVATCIWEEGGGVNNLYMSLGPGNALFFNVADSNGAPPFKAQAFGDFTLTPDRWYHILGRWEGGSGIETVELWIDGVKQSVAAGDIPITDNTFSSHSGDYTYSGGDGSLDTGGTDITYAKSVDMVYAWWATASKTSTDGVPLLTDAERRTEVFAIGCPVEDTLAADTEANMQTAMDAIAPEAYSDVPGALKISRPTGGGDLRIELDSVTFDDRVSMHVFWLGTAGEELTLVNNGTSNVDAAMCEAPYGGTVVVENPATLTINGLINGAELRIYDDNGAGGSFGDELDGIETLSGTSFQYSHTGATNAILVQMIATGYEEENVPFTLGAEDQTLTIVPRVDNNL